MAILVYKLTCGASGKAYVGITARALHTRRLEHCERSRQGVRNSRLYAAMRKHGLDSFTREIIATADTEDEARLYERTFIRDLRTYEDGYNCNEGGCGWLRVPDGVREKIGAAQRGKLISAESRRKMSQAKQGRRECADNFGVHINKGAKNPRGSRYLILCPDGDMEVVHGMREFCARTGARWQTLFRGQTSKGYSLLQKLGAPPPSASALNVQET